MYTYALMGQALMPLWAGPYGTGPCGPPWPLVGRALVGLAFMGLALMGQALMGRALVGWALTGSAIMAFLGICLCCFPFDLSDVFRKQRHNY